MEQWKVDHYLTNFMEACDGNPHQIISHAKKLRNMLDRLNNPEQETQVLDEIVPLLDDRRAHVRQCAACIVLNMPIERFSSMPPTLHIQRYDANGGKYYDRQWENKVPPEKQQVEWMEYVAHHLIYLEDKRNEQPYR